MRTPPLSLLLAALGALPCAAARSAWLHCAATGADVAGPFSVQTIVVDVGPVNPERLAHYKARLATYVMRLDDTAKGLRADCLASEDSAPATTQYTLAMQDAARHLGWDHLTVVQPGAWLKSTEIVNSAEHP